MTEQKSEITLGELMGVGVSLVIIGLVFTFGTDILSDVNDDYYPTCAQGAAVGTAQWDTINKTCYNSTAANGSIQVTGHNFSDEYLSSNSTMAGLGEIPKKLPTIALIIAVSVIITVLVRAFMKAR